MERALRRPSWSAVDRVAMRLCMSQQCYGMLISSCYFMIVCNKDKEIYLYINDYLGIFDIRCDWRSDPSIEANAIITTIECIVMCLSFTKPCPSTLMLAV